MTWDPDLWDGFDTMEPPPSPNGFEPIESPVPADPDARPAVILPYLPVRFWGTRERLALEMRLRFGERAGATHREFMPQADLLEDEDNRRIVFDNQNFLERH